LGRRWRVSNLKYVLRAYGDGNLFGEPYGVGPVKVVWLHGWARSGRDFARSAEILAESGIASVAMDMPGFGASPDPTVVGGARHYAELLLPALKDLGDAPLVLVGHSFGGRVAAALAANHPEVVRALVLTGVPLLRTSSPRKASPSYRLIRWLHGRGFISERRMEAARQRYGSTDYRNASGIMRDVLVVTVNESYEDELTRIASPVTLVWGESDQEVSLEVAKRAQAMLTTTHSLLVLSGVGHMVPISAPEDLAEAALAMTH
jgi:pimeloyl-ACP methyl ester carboxylesterase